jgi:hypothetical protein
LETLVTVEEIFVWGEEGAIASPPQLELIQQNITKTGRNGWDGADYKDRYQAYTNYIDGKGLRKYYPSISELITSLGDIMYYEHGRLVEDVNLVDLYIINAESWINELQQLNVFPKNKVFHPSKTWAGHNFFVREHPFFDDLPVNKGMNWEYQQLVVLKWAIQ